MDTKKNADSKSCELCHASFLCGSLSGILKIIEGSVKNHNDTYCQELYREFRSRIERYGYSYPDGSEKKCWLSDKPSIINDLLKESTALYKEIIKRQSCPLTSSHVHKTETTNEHQI